MDWIISGWVRYRAPQSAGKQVEREMNEKYLNESIISFHENERASVSVGGKKEEVVDLQERTCPHIRRLASSSSAD